MRLLTTFGIGQTPNQVNGNFNTPTQQTTVLDSTNPQFLRNVVLSQSGVRLVRPAVQSGLQTNQIVQALISLEPTLTWPPIVTLQPASQNVLVPNGANFSMAANGEYDSILPVSFRWQNSTNNGVTWTNMADGGVYSNTGTNHLNISNIATLNANLFRCIANSSAGNNTTNSAQLILIDPWTDLLPNLLNSNTTGYFNSTGHGYSTIAYQWQNSANNAVAGGFTNMVDGGVFTGTNTRNLAISNSVNLVGFYYRVQVNDTAGVNWSNPGRVT